MKTNNKVPLPEALKEHFADIELSSQQLEQLTQMESLSKSRESGKSGWRFWLVSHLKRSPYRFATAMVLLLAVTLSWSFIKKEDLSQQVIREIAYNHNKQMVMEVKSPELKKITDYLSQLGFSLIQSRQLQDSKWELLGGRYCSIQGKLAAQLKLRDRSDNRIYTFYQAQLPHAMNDLRQHEGYVDGVKVSLWQENNLLLGLAGQPDTNNNSMRKHINR